MPIPTYDQNALNRLCRSYHVLRLAVFGSVSRETDRPHSDLDLLVEFDAQHIPGMFTFVALERSLGELFGRKVDLNTPGFLSPYFRKEVENQAIPIYGG